MLFRSEKGLSMSSEARSTKHIESFIILDPTNKIKRKLLKTLVTDLKEDQKDLQIFSFKKHQLQDGHVFFKALLLILNRPNSKTFKY